MMLTDPDSVSLLIVERNCRWLLTSAAGTMLTVGLTAFAVAADASKWDGDNRAAVRLIAGSYGGEGEARIGRAGIEIRLGAGWKMYWRHPGDAGVPPVFDFAGSTNVTEVAVMWPAPQRFSDEGVHMIVYKDSVVLPLRVVPENAAKAVTLRLKLVYGICEKLCILAEAKSELLLSGDQSAKEPAIAAAEARVPRKVEIGEDGRLSIRAVVREMGRAGLRAVIEVGAPAAASVDLFAEGPGSDWAAPLPQLISSEGGVRRFSLDLSEIPPRVGTSGAMLRLTATADREAIEVLVPY